jgi:hypothetical protein
VSNPSRDTGPVHAEPLLEVKSVDDEKRAAACRAVLDYLARNPRASDSLSGIATWWLRGAGVRVTDAALESALESLVEDGRILRRPLPDGTVLYAAADGGREE